jgi:hypothetical protein
MTGNHVTSFSPTQCGIYRLVSKDYIHSSHINTTCTIGRTLFNEMSEGTQPLPCGKGLRTINDIHVRVLRHKYLFSFPFTAATLTRGAGRL